jgi:hypothetical protein
VRREFYSEIETLRGIIARLFRSVILPSNDTSYRSRHPAPEKFHGVLYVVAGYFSLFWGLGAVALFSFRLKWLSLIFSGCSVSLTDLTS